MSALEVRNLSVDVGGRRLVDEVSFTLVSGEVMGLIGPNGAGKTTSLRAILGLVPFTAERVAAGGRVLGDLSATERARAIAYLPQGRHVAWPLSAAATVALGRYPHAQRADASVRTRAIEALELVGLAELAERDVRTLSGGELALVLLARALVVDAPVLLADEPTASLDPAHQLAVMERLRARAEAGSAILIVLHDLSLAARYCDRLMLMSGGRIVGSGPSDEVAAGTDLEVAYGVHFLRGEIGGKPVLQAELQVATGWREAGKSPGKRPTSPAF
ncbi:MAG: ABC transporter ATP-binding protein [Alphaproteobacteria bacterium]